MKRMVVREALRCLRRARKYRGKFSRDEFEAAQLILGEALEVPL